MALKIFLMLTCILWASHVVKMSESWSNSTNFEERKDLARIILPTLRRFNLSWLDLVWTTSFGNNLCLCRYGVGDGEVGLEDVVCEGGERHLLRCRHSSVWGVNTTCKHQYDIAIACCRLSIWLFKTIIVYSFCLSSCQSACLPNGLFVCLSANLSIHLSVV